MKFKVYPGAAVVGFGLMMISKDLHAGDWRDVVKLVVATVVFCFAFRLDFE